MRPVWIPLKPQKYVLCKWIQSDIQSWEAHTWWEQSPLVILVLSQTSHSFAVAGVKQQQQMECRCGTKNIWGETCADVCWPWNYVKGLAIWEINQKTEPFQRIWERFGNETTFVKPNSQHHPSSSSNNKFYFPTCSLSNSINSCQCASWEYVQFLHVKVCYRNETIFM